MSDDDIRRIADAIEKIVEQTNKKSDEASIVAGVYGAFATQLETILDESTNEFTLRRELRNFVRKVQELTQT